MNSKQNLQHSISEAEDRQKQLRDCFFSALSGHYKNNLVDFLYDPLPLAANNNIGDFDKILACDDQYYVYQCEVDVINRALSSIYSYLPSGITMLEYGPGPVDSVLNKSGPLINTLNPEKYIAFDRCLRYGRDAAALAKKINPKLESEFLTIDFFDKSISHKTIDSPLIISFGGTLFNIDADSPDEYLDNLSTHLYIWRSQLPENGYLLISQDTNNNAAILLSAYFNAWNESFIKNILIKMQSDPMQTGLDSNKWDYVVHWNEKTFQVDMGFVANDNFALSIGSQHVTVNKGQYLHVESSYKLPEAVFLDAARKGGFMPVQTFRQPGNPVVLHLLRVAA